MKKIPLLLSVLGLGLAQQVSADSPAETADRMLDPTRNTAAFKDPKAFVEWTNAMMNPATSMALTQKGMDPNTYLRMTAGMINPATLQNYMQLTDPAVAMKWMAAGLDPNFYTALLSQGLNPANLLPWLTAPMSPQAMSLGMQMLNPAMYGNWMTAPVSPQAMNTMMAPINPNLYMNWLGTGMNPQTYGSWGAMATNPLAAPAQMAAAAAPAAPAPSSNPFDPNALLKMLPIPGAQPAAK
jgi:hypothetical protein